MKSKLITTLQTALFAIHKGLERYPKILPGMTLVQLLAVDRGNYTPYPQRPVCGLPGEPSRIALDIPLDIVV